MRVVYRRILLLSCAFALLIVSQATLVRVNAQDITLTLAVSAYQKEVFNEKLLADFEAENPGIKLNVIAIDTQLWSPSLGYGGENMPQEFFDKTEQFVSTGDVIQLDYWGRMSPESTTAGYYLNLKPLADTDATLNSDDFYKGVWQFYQWDDGLWALPYQATTHVLTYDPAAFDAAGLSYPDPSWTMTDFANAARALTVKDASGKITVKGIDAGFYDDWYLIRSLMGTDGLADTTLVPNPPQFSANIALQQLLTEWLSLKVEGVVGPIYPQGGGIIDYTAPFGINADWRITSEYADGRKHSAAAMLPGNRAGLEVSGFAVSAGTQYPEAAYKLAKYLTARPEMYLNTMYVIPARRSLAESSPNSVFSSTNKLDPAILSVLESALENGFSVNDVRYFDYLYFDLGQRFPTSAEDGKMPETPTQDAVIEVLQAAEKRANDWIPVLTENKASVQITLATPAPAAELAPGEVALKFGLLSSPDMTRKPEWEAFMKSFAEEDEQVGRVDLDVTFGGQTLLTDAYDCFYVSSELLSGFDLSLLLPIDPYLNADNTIDKGDFIGTSLNSFQANNLTYGLPMMIEPELLRLDVAQFEKAGVPLPDDGWTMDEFLNALSTLKAASGDPDKVIFSKTGSDTSGGYMLALMAAAGALPIDSHTNPLTINFTDPETTEVMRQILDLAKQKQINYQALVKFTGQSVPSDAPIYTDRFSALEQNFRMIMIDDAKFKTVPYPSGKYTPLMYGTTGIFISAKAQQPDACYRLMSKISQSPSLFSAMPARRSVLDSPSFEASVGADKVTAFKSLADRLSDPQAIRIPSAITGGYTAIEGYYVERWLFRVFDRYVLEGADLDVELAQAQQFAQDFMTCTEGLPPMDMTNPSARYEGIQKCVEKVDPSISQS